MEKIKAIASGTITFTFKVSDTGEPINIRPDDEIINEFIEGMKDHLMEELDEVEITHHTMNIVYEEL